MRRISRSSARGELKKDDRTWLERHFDEAIFPVLTPLSIDPAHPFPFIPNLGFSMALALIRERDSQTMNALLRLPTALQRFVEMPITEAGVYRFVPLESVVALFISKLFPDTGCAGRARSASSATRTWKWPKKRKTSCARSRVRSSAAVRGSVIRIEFDHVMPEGLRNFVSSELNVSESRVSIMDGCWRSTPCRRS